MDISIYDNTFTPVGIVDVFDSIIWTDKYTDIGDVEIVDKINQNSLFLFKKNYILSIPYTDQFMIINSIKIESDIENGDKLTVNGRSLVSILNRRIIWSQTNLTGNFQDAIEQLLNENAISPTNTDRTIPNLVFITSTDPSITSLTIDEQFYGDNLLDVIKGLCEANNVGFKLVLDVVTKQLNFSLYFGADRSFDQLINPHVVFSPEFDNLLGSDYIETLDGSITVTLVGGEGEGFDQKVLSVESPIGAGTGLDRRESYTDASDVSSNIDGGTLTPEEYNALLENRGLQAIIEAFPIAEFGATVDSSPRAFVYGRDYFLGDIVQAENEYGINGPMRVIELTISEDASGYQVYPTFEMI